MGKFRFRLSWLLIVLALVGLAPTLAVSVVAVLRTAETSKDASIAKLNDTVSPLAGAVENEISRTAEAVSRMASLPVEDLARKDLHPARTVTGIDNFGGELITEVVPNSIVLSHRGGVTPRGIPYDTLLRSTALGTPQLSNLLFVGPNKEPRIAIVAPGPETPEGRYFVTLLLSPDRLVRLLQGQGAQNSSILIAVTDGQGRLVARSKNPGPFIGKPVPDWKNLQAVKSSRGNFEGISKEGAKIVFSFVIMPDTPGWAVVVGEPFNAFTARWRQPIQDLAIGGLIALLLALAASAVLARYIVNSLKRIVHFSELVAEGTPPPDKFPEATIREFHALSLSIEQSQASLLARTELLAKSERRYRSLAEVGALVFWTQGLNGEVLTATGWRELTGEDEAEALGTGWMKRVHPEDVERLMTDRARIKDHTFVDSEFRIKCTSGNWRWVKSRGSLVADGPNGEAEWVGVLDDIDARRQAQERLAHLAMHDTLTGLGNRAQLIEHLKELETLKQPRGIMFLDLDRFKHVNDTLGHATGDALLHCVARRIVEVVGTADLVTRLGGDEFAIVTRDRCPTELAALMIDRLSIPYQINDHSIVVGASIGIASLDHQSAESALRDADLALNVAKSEGRGTYRVFEPAMFENAQRRGVVEAELRRAVERNEMEVYYQPLVNPAEESIAGFEALLRWNHPERGVLPPSEFIELAEDIGLIHKIGAKVLMDACAEATKWPGSIKVAVNVAAAQLRGNDLTTHVLTALEASGLAPNRLELEISQNVVMDNLQSAMAALLRLKAAGCSIAMDDFGSGGSSIGYLTTFPFDRIKIDKSFILNLDAGIENGTIVRAVTSICESLGITSTAEGVETPEQFSFVKDANCTEVQGFLFGKAVQSDQIPDLIRRLGGATMDHQTESPPKLALSA